MGDVSSDVASEVVDLNFYCDKIIWNEINELLAKTNQNNSKQ